MIYLSTSPPLMASWLETAWDRLPWILLGSGVAVLWLSLLVLMLSRWGQARPLSKCAALSVLVHVLLLGYAYMTNLLQPPMLGLGRSTVSVQLLTDPLTESEPERQPSWQPSSQPPVELAEAALPNPELWQHETPVHRAEMVTDSASEMAELARDLPEAAMEVTSSAEDLAAPAAAQPVPATPMLVEPPSRQPRVEQPVATPPPLSPAPTVPAIARSSSSHTRESPSQAPQADRHSMALLPNHQELADLIATEEDRDPNDVARRPVGHTVAGSDGVASRVPSRTVSVAKRRPAATGAVPPLYHGRLQQQRQQLAFEQGGSAATEAAVEAALAWLARAQDQRDGHWDTQAWEGGHESRDFAIISGQTDGLQANSATTGLALLAFLAAGHTHRQGDYQEQVARGLEFLRHSQSPTTGSLAGNAGRYVAMYCHGIATLAMSEAYILTRDESLRPVLERAVHYTVVTQHPTTGGWRYRPGDQGDTSQFGWQVMALVSARSAGIAIPARVWQGANRWLQRVSLGEHGGLACYTPDRRIPSHSMTAEALACRFFLQTGRSRAVVEEAANFISREGLGREPMNLYYFYYATLALYQVQDHRWVAWNRALTARLLATQRDSGSLGGSWDPNTVWGHTGGRVYSTALACLCLETYYRYLPVLDELGPTAARSSWRR